MAKAAEWARRVAAWRASGRTSTQFAEEQGFSRGSLRYWSSRLGRIAKAPIANVAAAKSEPRVAMARVVVASRPSESRVRERVAEPAALVVEVGAAKVCVRPGFDASLLRAVITTLREVLR